VRVCLSFDCRSVKLCLVHTRNRGRLCGYSSPWSLPRWVSRNPSFVLHTFDISFFFFSVRECSHPQRVSPVQTMPSLGTQLSVRSLMRACVSLASPACRASLRLHFTVAHARVSLGALRLPPAVSSRSFTISSPVIFPNPPPPCPLNHPHSSVSFSHAS
jgi:hypothetical protein